MAGYRIAALGSLFVISTDEQAILICQNLNTARRAIADAERPPHLSFGQILARRAADRPSIESESGGDVDGFVRWAAAAEGG